MFEDNQLYFIEETGGHVDDNGLWVDGILDAVGNVPCDKQPYSHDLAYRDYGYDGNVVDRVFCDYDNHIKLGELVTFKSDLKTAEQFMIKKIVNWDDQHCEVLIDNV